jgi:hypothetical protein
LGAATARDNPEEDLQTDLGVVRELFGVGGVFNFHVAKLFGIKDFTTIQTLDKFRVFVAGYDSNPGVFAGGSHRSFFYRK